MNDTGQVDLSKGSIPKLLFSLALPSILAQIINVLYNIVDRMYIGHIPETGNLALTGVGVTMPIIMAVSAFAALVCMGGAPRAAIFLGKQDKDMAERIMTNCLWMLIVIAVILTIVLELFGIPLLNSFGGSPNTLPYAWSYLRIYAVGTIFVQVALGMNAFINTQGYAKWGMATVALGAVCNIILDPILIFVFNMGVQGAALATIISQACSAVFVLWFLASKHSYLHLQKRYFKPSWAVLAPCLMLGLSPFIMQITESLITICFNSSLFRYGGDMAVGAMTVLASVMQFSMLPLQGMTQGAQPILSYNYGAKCYDRIKKTFKLLLITSLCYSMLLWLLCEVFPGMFAAMFTPDPELSAYIDWSLRVYMFGSGLFGAQIACQQTFIALGNAKTSLFLAVFRKIIMLIPLIYILPVFIENKVFAVFLAEPVADLCAVAVTSTMFFRYFSKLMKGAPQTNPTA